MWILWFGKGGFKNLSRLQQYIQIICPTGLVYLQCGDRYIARGFTVLQNTLEIHIFTNKNSPTLTKVSRPSLVQCRLVLPFINNGLGMKWTKFSVIFLSGLLFAISVPYQIPCKMGQHHQMNHHSSSKIYVPLNSFL